jgi:hypothetical protein
VNVTYRHRIRVKKRAADPPPAAPASGAEPSPA